MKQLTVICLFLMLATGASSQALQEINFNYLYDPNQPYEFSWKIVHQPERWTVLFKIEVRDTVHYDANKFRIQWESRASISDKTGDTLQSETINPVINVNTRSLKSGSLVIPTAEAPPILVAKVINLDAKRAWLYYETLNPANFERYYLMKDGAPVVGSYVKLNSTVRPVGIPSDESVVVTYFSHEFPPAAPSFSEGLSRVSKTMNVDSTFTLSAGQTLSVSKSGLYLLQKDTAQMSGLAFRAEDDYPKFARIETLVDPLVYVCTRQEYEKLKSSRGDKKVFDRTILGITGNAERAKDFMRSYFQHVEWANYYFSSYKQGWMTDRGMTYIVFGIPNEVFKFVDREVWNYKTGLYSVEFTFVHSGSLFDPANYVLVRDKKYQQTWYEVIDLWRKSRF